MAKKRTRVDEEEEEETSLDEEDTWVDEDGFVLQGDKPPWYDGLIKHGYDLDDIENLKSGRLRERTDEVGRLVNALKYALTRTRSPDDEVSLPGSTLVVIIQALERVPRSGGNPRGGWMAKALESCARHELLKIKQKKIEEGQSAVDAEWDAAKEGVPIFFRITGRKCKAGYIRRIIQGKRSQRRRKSGAT